MNHFWEDVLIIGLTAIVVIAIFIGMISGDENNP